MDQHMAWSPCTLLTYFVAFPEQVKPSELSARFDSRNTHAIGYIVSKFRFKQVYNESKHARQRQYRNTTTYELLRWGAVVDRLSLCLSCSLDLNTCGSVI